MDASKLGRNWSKLAKIYKNWFYVHFEKEKNT